MDQRILKTKQKIKEAYLDLLFKVEPNKIQVKDLCKKAHINRSTFYDRYGYIEALENKIIEEEMNEMVLKEFSIDDPNLYDFNSGMKKHLIEKYIHAFISNKVLCRFCTVENREKYIDIIAHKQINLSTVNLTSITYYEAYFQCMGALATLIEWINDHKNQSLEEIIDIVYSHSEVIFKNLKLEN